MRERERARARARGEETFQSVRRSPANSELQSAPISRAPVRRPQSEIAIDASQDRDIDRDLAKIEIAPSRDRAVDRDLDLARSRSTAQSREASNAISPSRDRAVDGEIAPDRDRDRRRERKIRDREISYVGERGRSCGRRRERKIAIDGAVVGLDLSPDWIWVVACVFLDLCFPSSFPNTRKYFPENFLKCNQTHGNIFHFRKLAFPENMYFPKNVLRQPNTA